MVVHLIRNNFNNMEKVGREYSLFFKYVFKILLNKTKKERDYKKLWI